MSMLIFLDGKVLYFKILIIKVSLYATPAGKFTRRRLYLHTQFYRVCWNAMIRIHGKRVLTVLAFVMAICVSFQLGLIWSTRSFFFWHCSWTTRCRKPRAAHTITRTENESHDNFYFANSSQIISYNQEILYATSRSSYDYLIRSR